MGFFTENPGSWEGARSRPSKKDSEQRIGTSHSRAGMVRQALLLQSPSIREVSHVAARRRTR